MGGIAAGRVSPIARPIARPIAQHRARGIHHRHHVVIGVLAVELGSFIGVEIVAVGVAVPLPHGLNRATTNGTNCTNGAYRQSFVRFGRFVVELFA